MSAAQVVAAPARSGRGWLVAARIGLVLAAVQALFNTVNGVTQALGPAQTEGGEAIPAWVGWSLLIAGVVTLAALVPAWRGNRAAIWAVAVSRLSELTALLVFVDAFPAEESEKPFYVVIAAVGVVIAALVLCGLRARRR